MKKAVIYCVLIFCTFVSYVQSVNATLTDEKQVMEASIKEKTEKIVEKILGNKDFIVLVNVDIDFEKSKEQPKQSQNLSQYAGMDMMPQEFLPGITYNVLPVDAPNFQSSKAIINKIVIRVTIDMNTDNDLKARIEKEVLLLLNLKDPAKDFIEVNRIVFSKPKPTLRDYYNDWGKLFYWLGTMIFITLFFLGPLRVILRSIARAMEMRVEADTRIRGNSGLEQQQNPVLGGANTLALPGGGNFEVNMSRRKRGEEETGSVKRFDFINGSNIKNLIFLLRKEMPEKIAIVTSYLAPEFSTQIINSLTPDNQKQVFRNLSNIKLFDPDEVDAIEKAIKMSIDYIIGGENYFSKILDEVDRDTQDNILSTLESENPALANKLRKQLFYFEDVLGLDKASLQKLIRAIQMAGDINLAVAIKTADEEIKTKFMDCLTEGARAILAEQMDLLGETSPKKVDDERRQIVLIVKNLVKTGEIVYNKGEV